MPRSAAALAGELRSLGAALGFDAVGFGPAAPGPRDAFLREWLARGYAGEMGWIGRRVQERLDPRRVLPGAQSAIAVALSYAPGPDAGAEANGAEANGAEAAGAEANGAEAAGAEANGAEAAGAEANGAEADGAEAGGAAEGGPEAGGAAEEEQCAAPGLRIARYAGGEDYHTVLGDRLRAYEAAIEALLAPQPVRLRGYVDTGPLLERSLAAQAGLGWIGKNTCLLHRRLGSYVFLGVVLTDLALPHDAQETDHCGSCRACLDACPTDAFPAPYQLDASRCLAYTTIELRGPTPEPLRAPQGDWLFGCDICQEVCPWNRPTRLPALADAHGLRARLAPRAPWRSASLAWLLSLDEDAWRSATRKSALRRAKFRGLMRNALIAAGNSRDPAHAPALRLHASGPDAMLAGHARWALARLASGGRGESGGASGRGAEGGEEAGA